MKINKHILVFGVLLFLLFNTSTPLFAQWDKYWYIHQIEDVTETWHEIDLPAEMHPKVDDKYEGVRIMFVSESGDTSEVPYVFRRNMETQEQIKTPHKIINKTQNEEGFFYTFEFTERQELDYIQLSFGQDNFDWMITLEGSNDQNEWFEIVKDYRILGIRNELDNYKFTTIKFSPVQYHFLRLKVPSKEKPNLLSANIQTININEGKSEILDDFKLEITEDKEAKQSLISIKLPYYVSLSYLKIPVEYDYDYYRDIAIQSVVDSFITEKGRKYQFRTRKNSVLSSLEEKEFKFSFLNANELLIKVNNHDNPPLKYGRPILKRNVFSLVAQFPSEKGEAFLLYGHRYPRKPIYDIQKFQDKIPANLTALSLGKVKRVTKGDDGIINPLFQNKYWLWGLMLLAIALLGWFTYKMIASEKPANDT